MLINANHDIKFYTIDGIKIGKEIGLGGRINTVLQSAFFKLSGIIPEEDAIKYMKDAATASYSKKGEAIVKMKPRCDRRWCKSYPLKYQFQLNGLTLKQKAYSLKLREITNLLG